MSSDISADEARALAKQANTITFVHSLANGTISNAARIGKHEATIGTTNFSPDIVSQVSHSLVARGFEVERLPEALSVKWPDPEAAAALVNDALTS